MPAKRILNALSFRPGLDRELGPSIVRAEYAAGSRLARVRTGRRKMQVQRARCPEERRT
jgi:hypothetical protein